MQKETCHCSSIKLCQWSLKYSNIIFFILYCFQNMPIGTNDNFFYFYKSDINVLIFNICENAWNDISQMGVNRAWITRWAIQGLGEPLVYKSLMSCVILSIILEMNCAITCYHVLIEILRLVMEMDYDFFFFFMCTYLRITWYI